MGKRLRGLPMPPAAYFLGKVLLVLAITEVSGSPMYSWPSGAGKRGAGGGTSDLVDLTPTEVRRLLSGRTEASPPRTEQVVNRSRCVADTRLGLDGVLHAAQSHVRDGARGTPPRHHFATPSL